MRLPGRITPLALALSVGCGSQPEGGSDPGDPGFDLDEDPALIADLEGKADGNVCKNYAGGPLSGDDSLVLVNKQDGQQLSSSWAPNDLVGVPPALMMPGRQGELRAPVLVALNEMFDAAASEAGLKLGVRSAYRSFRTQCITFDYKVRQHGLEHAKRFSAEPGRSQHQLGTTADITAETLDWKLNQDMGQKQEGQWLEKNAYRFGFALSYPDGKETVTGYAYEPWHFRFIGKSAAAEMIGKSLILEEYLAACQRAEPSLICERAGLPHAFA